MSLASEILLSVLNSLWQAALVAALVWTVLRFAHVNAATRYAIWWVALGVVVALPAAPRVAEWWRTRTPRPQQASAPRPTPARVTLPVIDQPAMVTLKEERSVRWPLWIAGLWAGLLVFRLWQIGRSYFYLRGVKRRAIASQEALPPIPRHARLLLSCDVASPMAVGFLHPAVILPESLPAELAQPEMEHVLLHEAAHIARKDDWSNLLARLLGAALALHPVAWWILRQIEREREIACDDWVVARVGSARPYAQSLARMSELRWARRTPEQGSKQGEALASGVFGGGSRLGERIELLLRRGRAFSTKVSRARLALSVAALLACAVTAAFAPRAIAFAQSIDLRFAASSIRPAAPQPPSETFMGISPGPGGGLRARDISLLFLVNYGYGVDGVPIPIVGGPDWTKTEMFDVVATPEPGPKPPSTVQLREMTRNMLTDRFKLAVHREMRELPVYALTVAKNGPKLQRELKEPLTDPPGGYCDVSRKPWCTWIAQKGSMADLVAFLGRLGKPVVDRTGLTGEFDFRLKYDPQWQGPEPPPDELTRVPIRAAIQEQFGLKLDDAKAPVEVLVIDHVERPDAN